MLHEVRGVAVMALAGDVLPDVVQQRREVEHLPIAGAEPVQRLRLVEELQREPRHLLGVRKVGVAPARKTRDRSSTQRAGIVGPVVGVMGAHRIEHDPLAQRPVARGQTIELEVVEHGDQQRRTGG